MVVGAALFGYFSLSSTGTGHLDTVPLGHRIDYTASGSYRANIFVTRGLDARIDCQVTEREGRSLVLRDASPYTVNSRYNMEAIYGFNVMAGTPYVVTCRVPDRQGSFAIVELSPTGQRVAFATGVAGGMLIIVGAIGWFTGRRRASVVP